MQIHQPNANSRCNELELLGKHLPFSGATVLELGCGTARMTNLIAERFQVARIIATEVDSIQHAKNLASDYPACIEFRTGGAEAIDLSDNSVDIVLMFKSLHHVPSELMAKGMQEIARVLKPGGLAWISEPVYAGDFNDILRLFHDEKIVRELAFQAVHDIVGSGKLELVEQVFCNTGRRFADFDEFVQRILNVTHTNHQLDDALYQQVKQRFETHLDADGAYFDNPARFDILRKPA